MVLTAPVFFYFVNLVTVWITLIAPVTTLVAFFYGISPTDWYIPSMLFSPVLLAGGRFIWNLPEARVRIWIMQLIGVGAMFAIAALFGGLLTWVIPPQWAAVLAIALGLVWVIQAAKAAQDIKNVHLEFSDTRITQTLRVVQISDVHIGSRDANFLRRVVQQVNSHSPDLVLITGDLVDSELVGHDDLLALRLIKCPTYMSTGNHEFDIDINACLSAIEAQGVTLLRDQSQEFGDLQLIGIDDRKRGDEIAPVLEQLPKRPSKFRVLLYHRPDGWPAAQSDGIDLMLAGHTHQGQIWPFNHLVKCYYHKIAGHYSDRHQNLYVSSGTGTWGPTMRFGSQCEMTVIDLKAA